MPLSRRILAEAIGTFGLVFFCCGVIVAGALPNTGIGLMSVALAQALALAVLVSSFMNISGAHFNPAVTLGFLVVGRIRPGPAGAYLLAQLVGAVAGAWLVNALMPGPVVQLAALGTPMLQNGIALGTAVGVEAVLTFFLMSAFYGTVVAPTAPAVGGFGIGLVMFFGIMVGGPLTGAAVNPARALGPALISGNWIGHVVYWIGPLVGAVVAAVVWERGLMDRKAVEA